MSFITDIFKTPEVEPPPKPKYPSKEEEKKRLRRGAAGGQTILTSPLGVSGEAQTKKKTLLGGGA